MQKTEEILDGNEEFVTKIIHLNIMILEFYMLIATGLLAFNEINNNKKKEDSENLLELEKMIKSILNVPLQDYQNDKLAVLSEKELPKFTWKDVAEYCLNECDSYQEFKVVYDMLVMFMGNMQDEEWLKTKQLLKKRKRQLGAGINIENAKEVVLEKNIECEINNIEKGGVGVSISKTTKKSKK